MRCPKCGKGSTLSVYFTTSGVGFRLSNFKRHVDQTHKHQSEEVNPEEKAELNRLSTQLSSEKHKNKTLRSKLIAKNREIIKIQKENAAVCLDKIQNANAEVIATFEKATERIKSNESLASIGSKTSNTSSTDEGFHSSSMSEYGGGEWSQKVVELELELEKYKAALIKANTDRREMLHKYLDLKGKVRVACRLRPSLDACQEIIEFKRKAQGLSGNYSVPFQYPSFLKRKIFSSNRCNNMRFTF